MRRAAGCTFPCSHCGRLRTQQHTRCCGDVQPLSARDQSSAPCATPTHTINTSCAGDNCGALNQARIRSNGSCGGASITEHAAKRCEAMNDGICAQKSGSLSMATELNRIRKRRFIRGEKQHWKHSHTVRLFRVQNRVPRAKQNAKAESATMSARNRKSHTFTDPVDVDAGFDDKNDERQKERLPWRWRSRDPIALLRLLLFTHLLLLTGGLVVWFRPPAVCPWSDAVLQRVDAFQLHSDSQFRNTTARIDWLVDNRTAQHDLCLAQMQRLRGSLGAITGSLAALQSYEDLVATMYNLTDSFTRDARDRQLDALRVIETLTKGKHDAALPQVMQQLRESLGDSHARLDQLLRARLSDNQRQLSAARFNAETETQKE